MSVWVIWNIMSRLKRCSLVSGSMLSISLNCCAGNKLKLVIQAFVHWKWHKGIRLYDFCIFRMITGLSKVAIHWSMLHWSIFCRRVSSLFSRMFILWFVMSTSAVTAKTEFTVPSPYFLRIILIPK
jgi:hypothetical protein